MSIFRRESESDAPQTPQAAVPSPQTVGDRRPSGRTTLIAQGSKITGQIHGSTDLVVDGELEGEVRLESNVTVGAEGRIQGNVSARSVRIGGRVVGNVQGVERVEILTTGRLEGNVIAPRVMLAEGAFFKGKVEMTGQGQGQGQGVRQEQGVKAPPRHQPEGVGK